MGFDLPFFPFFGTFSLAFTLYVSNQRQMNKRRFGVKQKRKRILTIITTASLMLFVALAAPLAAQDEDKGLIEVKAGNVYPGEMAIKGFSLKKNSRIKVDGAVGLFYERGSELVFYGWILNSKTREVAWHMLEDNDRFDKGVNTMIERISLPKGDYEIYYTAQINRSDRVGDSNVVSRILSKIFSVNRNRKRYTRKYRDRLFLSVKASSRDMEKANGMELADLEKENAIVSMIRTHDDKRVKKAFSLSAETKVRIYAIGEGSRSSVYDYAWIEDIDHYKRVWTMKARDADGAGGARKNLVVDQEITLPAGKYLVHYVTDDSHSFEEWNAFPPDDPQFWGITIWPVSEKDIKNATLLKDFKLPEPVLELVRVRDEEMVSKAIKLDKPMDLRVLCIGEGNKSKRTMFDYGWIIDAETRKTVWEIKGRRTDHAGGADKNRMIDEVIRLEKGTYLVNYVTDDSHSYRDWNAAAPFDPKRWGITLWVMDENDRAHVKPVDRDAVKNENVLVSITRVRDDRRREKDFTLTEDTKIRIFAIGEGTRSGMADYGWIENRNSGKIIWEMTYRKTSHAGGASKNRLFNDTILLEKGNYELHYVTDGSHSFMDWNASPPDDPDSYGITILKEK
jgi:hypothetical protein